MVPLRAQPSHLSPFSLLPFLLNSFLPILYALSFSLLHFSNPSSRPPPPASASPSSSAPFATKITVPGIPNAGRVSDSLFRGAQPDPRDLAERKKLGITTIVDLCSESPYARDRERAQAHSLGIHFVSIPVGGFSTPTSAQLAEFFALFCQTPAQKILVHCESSEDRTGVLVAACHIAFDHWSSDQALSEMQAFGFPPFWHPSMVTFLRALPDRLRSDPTLESALANGLSSTSVAPDFLTWSLTKGRLPAEGGKRSANATAPPVCCFAGFPVLWYPPKT